MLQPEEEEEEEEEEVIAGTSCGSQRYGRNDEDENQNEPGNTWILKKSAKSYRMLM